MLGTGSRVFPEILDTLKIQIELKDAFSAWGKCKHHLNEIANKIERHDKKASIV